MKEKNLKIGDKKKEKNEVKSLSAGTKVFSAMVKKNF
jgi:hypothetical protein